MKVDELFEAAGKLSAIIKQQADTIDTAYEVVSKEINKSQGYIRIKKGDRTIQVDIEYDPSLEYVSAVYEQGIRSKAKTFTGDNAASVLKSGISHALTLFKE